MSSAVVFVHLLRKLTIYILFCHFMASQKPLVTDFDANTIQMIQTIYKRDFETFGYSLDISVS